jgi:Holliday junction resolvasome RuvABC endonuclease subunit
MNILALDPATNCGWAHSLGPSGTWDLSVRRDESGGMKFLRLVAKLGDVKFTAGIDLLVYEAARHAMPKMQGALVHQAEMQGVIKHWCEERAILYRGYSPMEIKKHATGKGNAGKPEMVAAAKVKWPGFNGDDNEADAKWLLDLAMKEYGKDEFE